MIERPHPAALQREDDIPFLADEKLLRLERSIRKEKLRRTHLNISIGTFQSARFLEGENGEHTGAPFASDPAAAPVSAEEMSAGAVEPDLRTLLEAERLLLGAARRVSGSRARKGAVDLEERILHLLEGADHWTHGDLVRWTGRPPSAVSRVLRRLEREGAVQRWRHAGDRRVVRVRLAPSGEGRARRAARARTARLRTAFGVLSADELTTLAPLLRRIRAPSARPGAGYCASGVRSASVPNAVSSAVQEASASPMPR